MPFPFINKKPSEDQKHFVMVTLTPSGVREAEAFDGSGNEFEILAALNQKRPQSIGDLAKTAQISFPETLKLCKSLKMRGLIQQASRAE